MARGYQGNAGGSAVASGAKRPDEGEACIVSMRGTEDFLYEDNQAFRRKCEEFGYDALTYEEGPGEHVWEYWDAHIQDVFAVVAASEIAPADRSTESLTRLIFAF